MTNTYYYYLSVGDGATADYLNLNDAVNYGVAWGGLAAPPAAPGKPRTVKLTLSIYGASNQALITNIRAIEAKLTQARRAAGPQGRVNTAGKNVTLGVQLDSTTMVYLDVRRGWLHYDERALSNIAGHVAIGAVLEAVCEPFGRGAPTTYTVSGTLVNGTGCFQYLTNIPGDEDPLTKVVVSDVSLSGIINTVELGRRALDGMASTDTVGAVTLTDSSPTIGAVNNWYLGGTCSQPASTPQMHGDHHVTVRLTDNETRLGQPTNLSVTAQPQPNVVQFTTGTGNTISWPQATGAGNDLLLVAITSVAATITPPTTWTSAGSVQTSTSPKIQVFTWQNAPAQSGTFIVSSTTSLSTWYLFEVQGTTGVATLTTNSGTSTTPSATNSGSGTGCEFFCAATNGSIASWGAVAPSTYVTVASGITAPASIIGYDLNNTVAAGSTTMSASVLWVACALTFTAPANTVGGTTLAAGTYAVQVGATAGSGAQVGQASVLGIATLAVPGTLAISWSAASGATGYRVYVNAGTAWEYVTSASTSITVSTMPTTVGTPVTNAGILQVRARVSVQGSATYQYGDVMSVTYGGGKTEDVYLGVVPLPPVVPQDGSAPPTWTLDVQVMHPSSTGFTVSTSIVWTMSASEDHTIVSYPSLNLASASVWTFDTNRWGDRFSCRLSTGAVLQPNSPFRLGPGNNLLFCRVCGAGGASDITNLKVTLQVTVTPRYRLLAT